MRLRTLATTVIAVLAAASGGLTATITPATAASRTVVGPGSEIVTPTLDPDGGAAQCTANFVYTRSGVTYLGYAAHCASDGETTSSNGCDSSNEPLPLGTKVEIDGVADAGTLAYNSWQQMQTAGWTTADHEPACLGNDFALVRLDLTKVVADPEMPYWGGPTGISPAGHQQGDTVVGYGNSSLRLGIRALRPKSGQFVRTGNNGWSHVVYLGTPAIPGDSGSGLLDDQGRAMGIASTITVYPLAASNSYSDVAKTLAFARNHGMSGLTLVQGGAFDSGSLGLYDPLLGL